MTNKTSFINFITEHSDSVFYAENLDDSKKKVLVFVHTLSYGGSQSALCSLLSRLQKEDYEIWVLSPTDGPFRETYSKDYNANCIIHTFLMDEPYKKTLRDYFDLVVINSICSVYYAYPFINTDIPVLFWIHESKNFLEQNKGSIIHPAFVSDNFHFLTAWPEAAAGIEALFTRKADILPIEIPDKFDPSFHTDHSDKVRFLLPGAYVEQKGFHVALQVIQNLPKEYLEKSEFTFLGHIGNEDFYNKLKNSALNYSNINFVGEVPSEKMKDYYQEYDCVIAPSFFDAGPLTAIEALMMEKLCIISNLCGASQYITDCKNGFVYAGDQPGELLKRILLVIEDISSLDSIAKSGRMTYEQFFSSEAVDQKFIHILESCELSGKT